MLVFWSQRYVMVSTKPDTEFFDDLNSPQSIPQSGLVISFSYISKKVSKFLNPPIADPSMSEASIIINTFIANSSSLNETHPSQMSMIQRRKTSPLQFADSLARAITDKMIITPVTTPFITQAKTFPGDFTIFIDHQHPEVMVKQAAYPTDLGIMLSIWDESPFRECLPPVADRSVLLDIRRARVKDRSKLKNPAGWLITDWAKNERFRLQWDSTVKVKLNNISLILNPHHRNITWSENRVARIGVSGYLIESWDIVLEWYPNLASVNAMAIKSK